MNIAIVIIGRMSSSRLPGKSLIPIGISTPLRTIIMSAKKYCPNESIFVLTSTDDADKPIVEYCTDNKVNFRCGHPDFVLDRLASFALEFPEFDYLLPVGTDCPFADFSLFHHIFEQVSDKLLSTNIFLMTSYFPSTFPAGIEPTLISTKWLSTLNIDSLHRSEREHFTNNLLLSSDRSRILNISLPFDLSFINFSLDTSDDYYFINQIASKDDFYDPCLEDLLSIIVKHKTLIDYINKHSLPKTLNAFISSPGMHKGIYLKMESLLKSAFSSLYEVDYQQSLLNFSDLSLTISNFIDSSNIAQHVIELPFDVNPYLRQIVETSDT